MLRLNRIVTTADGDPVEWRRGGFTVSTDPALLDVGLVHGFLTESYWSPGIPIDVVERAIDGSIPFGLYRGVEQIGFARVITDRATFAYIADVFVLASRRGSGLGTWLMECVLEHPELRGLRRWLLVTRDAQGLYRKVGFTFGEPWDWFYAIGELDGLELHLKEAPKNDLERKHRREHKHLDAAAGVDGIEAFYDHCVAHGVTIMTPLTITAWGTKDFYVVDPDGYIISFGGRPAAQP